MVYCLLRDWECLQVWQGCKGKKATVGWLAQCKNSKKSNFQVQENKRLMCLRKWPNASVLSEKKPPLLSPEFRLSNKWAASFITISIFWMYVFNSCVFWSIFEQKLHIYIFVKLLLVDLIFHFTADGEKSSKEDSDLDVPTLPRIEVVRRLRER